MAKTEALKTITIKITPDVHKDLKLIVLQEDTTIQDYVQALIVNEINQKKEERK